jgi:DNA-binding MarR family transcriptional regulator
MALLSEADERALQLRDLANHANCSLSRLSHVVTRLERRGWVSREPVPGDNRSTRAVLSEEGYQHVVAAAPGHVAHVRRLVFDGLTADEVAALDRLCHRIADRLEARSGV